MYYEDQNILKIPYGFNTEVQNSIDDEELRKFALGLAVKYRKYGELNDIDIAQAYYNFLVGLVQSKTTDNTPYYKVYGDPVLLKPIPNPYDK